MTFDPNFMLASDVIEEKLKFPLWEQPKIDGVRAGNFAGTLTGRSKKTHGNDYVTNFFSHQAFLGFDGEMAAADEKNPDLCRLTTSAISTHEGEPWLAFHVFDLVTPDTITQPYEIRYRRLQERVDYIRRHYPEHASHVKIVQCNLVNTLSDLQQRDMDNVRMGYEGTIVRGLSAVYKAGRSTVREGGLLRMKQFADAEAIVYAVEEGNVNLNEAKVDARGYTERSTHQANMVPNGMVGTLLCDDFTTGAKIRVSAGRLSHSERKFYFENQNKIIGRLIKYQHFLKGRKDLPRFPTFQCFRSTSDM